MDPHSPAGAVSAALTGLPIAALYAGLSALLILGLAIFVGAQRMRSGIGVGTGADERLLRAVRLHGNAVEHLPLCLILIALLELAGLAPWVLHAMGTALVLGRLAHIQGLWSRPGRSLGRAVGTLATWGVQLIAGLACLAVFLGLL